MEQLMHWLPVLAFFVLGYGLYRLDEYLDNKNK